MAIPISKRRRPEGHLFCFGEVWLGGSRHSQPREYGDDNPKNPLEKFEYRILDFGSHRNTNLDDRKGCIVNSDKPDEGTSPHMSD
jgi:hypothetical protein